MKTHLKTLLLIAISLMATVGLNAQEPFFFTKDGLKITLAEKKTAKERSTVTAKAPSLAWKANPLTAPSSTKRW